MSAFFSSRYFFHFSAQSKFQFEFLLDFVVGLVWDLPPLRSIINVVLTIGSHLSRKSVYARDRDYSAQSQSQGDNYHQLV